MVRFIKSVIKSIGRGIADDPEVERLAERYPRFFGFIKRRLSPHEELGLYLTLGMAFNVVFIIFFYKIVNNFVDQAPLITADERISNLIQILRTPSFTHKMLFITYLGKWLIVLLGVILSTLFLASLREWKYVISLWVSVGGGEVLAWLLKVMIARPRPPLLNAITPETSFSFPSGHSFAAVALYGLLAYILFRATTRKLLKFFVICTGLLIIGAIGFSRVYLGAHWPSDVFGSYAFGAAWLTTIITILEIRKKFHTSKPRTHSHKIIDSLFAGVLILLWLLAVTIYYVLHPAPYPHLTRPAIEHTYIAPDRIAQELFASLPRTSETVSGKPMEPIHLIFVGDKSTIDQAFARAGWYESDSIGARSTGKIARAVFLKTPYPNSPGVPAFWNTEPNDFAFGQPTDSQSISERFHIHFWETPFISSEARNIWVSTAHFDRAVKLAYGILVPVHEIDPAIDKAREKVKNDLLATGFVQSIKEFNVIEPALGKNAAGDLFFTDGKAYLIVLK